MSAQPKGLLTPEEYLAIERDVPTKHEYYRGEMFAMSGASREHNLITVNISASLHEQLRNRPCEVYQNDMRVKVAATGAYVYPDVVVTCQKPRFEDDVLDTLLTPQVVIEVESVSTGLYDRTDKFAHYRKIESLREYVLVSHDHPHIDRFALGDDGVWGLTDVDGLDGVLQLPTIDCQLRLADVYAKVEFPPRDALLKSAGIFRKDESP
jgi:Uma2 family endonuclease